jgi:hypothetical protein
MGTWYRHINKTRALLVFQAFSNDLAILHFGYTEVLLPLYAKNWNWKLGITQVMQVGLYLHGEWCDAEMGKEHGKVMVSICY